MVTRREWLAMTAGAGAALTLQGCMASADPEGAAVAAGGGTAPAGDRMIMRLVPKTGERLPAVGLGSSATFSSVARQEDKTALKDVMKAMVDLGGTVFDTAPSYGASEQVAGDIAAELGLTDRIFWATKVNVARGGSADPAAARAQIEASFARLKKPKIDLIQVHNLGDVPTQLGILNELKQQGRIRYTGVTTTSNNQYPALLEIMRNQPIDFIGLDYAIDNRDVEAEVLPVAQQQKIGVLVYVPFGRTRLWQRVGDRPVPDWASEFDATTWAQFFIKYVLAHPAVTVVTPATSQAKHMADNLAGGMGRLPDAAMRKRMTDLIDALPPAPGRGGGAG